MPPPFCFPRRGERRFSLSGSVHVSVLLGAPLDSPFLPHFYELSAFFLVFLRISLFPKHNFVSPPHFPGQRTPPSESGFFF